MERGADPNKENLVYPTTSLCYLCINPKEDMYEKTILLAEYGADALYANDETALFYAVRVGKFDNCFFLIDEEANANI